MNLYEFEFVFYFNLICSYTLLYTLKIILCICRNKPKKVNKFCLALWIIINQRASYFWQLYLHVLMYKKVFHTNCTKLPSCILAVFSLDQVGWEQTIKMSQDNKNKSRTFCSESIFRFILAVNTLFTENSWTKQTSSVSQHILRVFVLERIPYFNLWSTEES